MPRFTKSGKTCFSKLRKYGISVSVVTECFVYSSIHANLMAGTLVVEVQAKPLTKSLRFTHASLYHLRLAILRGS